MHSQQTVLDDIRILVVNAEQWSSELIDKQAQEKTDKNHGSFASPHNIAHTLFLARTIVLARKRQVCLIDTVHRSIYKPFKILACRIACHCNRTERVDRGLNQYIGNREKAALDSGRQTDLSNQLQASR